MSELTLSEQLKESEELSQSEDQLSSELKSQLSELDENSVQLDGKGTGGSQELLELDG